MTIKVSYSCLPNSGNIIKFHNNRILSEEKTQDQPKCNCRQKDTCLLGGHCLDKELIYRCILKENTTTDGVNYNGLTDNTFKDRFYKHCNSFKYKGKANSTELSKHLWEMKRKGIKKPIMHQSVIDHAKPYQNGSKRCNLCLTEKYHILASSVNLINKNVCVCVLELNRKSKNFKILNISSKERIKKKSIRYIEWNEIFMLTSTVSLISDITVGISAKLNTKHKLNFCDIICFFE